MSSFDKTISTDTVICNNLQTNSNLLNIKNNKGQTVQVDPSTTFKFYPPITSSPVYEVVVDSSGNICKSVGGMINIPDPLSINVIQEKTTGNGVEIGRTNSTTSGLNVTGNKISSITTSSDIILAPQSGVSRISTISEYSGSDINISNTTLSKNINLSPSTGGKTVITSPNLPSLSSGTSTNLLALNGNSDVITTTVTIPSVTLQTAYNNGPTITETSTNPVVLKSSSGTNELLTLTDSSNNSKISLSSDSSMKIDTINENTLFGGINFGSTIVPKQTDYKNIKMYVDCNYIGTVQNGTILNPYRTITQAIIALPQYTTSSVLYWNNYVIYVAAGTYNEDIRIGDYLNDSRASGNLSLVAQGFVFLGAVHQGTANYDSLNRYFNPYAATGTLTSPFGSTIATLTSGFSSKDDIYNNFTLTITAGTGIGQSATISSYIGSSRICNIAPPWTITPDVTSTFKFSDYPTTNKNLNWILDKGASTYYPTRASLNLLTDSSIGPNTNTHDTYSRPTWRISGNIYIGSTSGSSLATRELRFENVVVNKNLQYEPFTANYGATNFKLLGCWIKGNVDFPYSGSPTLVANFYRIDTCTFDGNFTCAVLDNIYNSYFGAGFTIDKVINPYSDIVGPTAINTKFVGTLSCATISQVLPCDQITISQSSGVSLVNLTLTGGLTNTYVGVGNSSNVVGGSSALTYSSNTLTIGDVSINGSTNSISTLTNDLNIKSYTGKNIILTPGSGGKSQITGLSTYIIPSNISIEDNITGLDLLNYSQNNCGWSTNTTGLTLTYDATSRTVTFNSLYGGTYYISGKQYTLSGGNLTANHSNVTGVYYVYMNSSAVLTIGTTFFTYPTVCNVGMFYYNSDAIPSYYNDGLTGIICCEFHTVAQNWKDHLNIHNTIGTYTSSGGIIGNFNYNTDGVVVGQLTMSSTIVNDEDFATTVDPITGDGSNPYFPCVFMIGSPAVWYVKMSKMPFVIDTSNIGTYNYNSGGTWSLAEPTNLYYFNIYACVTNYSRSSSTNNYGWIFIIGQNQFANQNLAQAETIASLNLSGFPFVEVCFKYQITIQYRSTYSTVSGKCAIAASQLITGNLVSYTKVSGGVTTSLPIGSITTVNTDCIPYSSGTYETENSNFKYNGTSFTVGNLILNGSTQTLTCGAVNTNYTININGYGGMNITNQSGSSNLFSMGSPLNTNKYGQINIYNSDSSTYGCLLRYYYGGSAATNYIKLLHGSGDSSTASNIISFGDGKLNLNSTGIYVNSVGGSAGLELYQTNISFKNATNTITFPNSSSNSLKIGDSDSRNGIYIQSNASSSSTIYHYAMNHDFQYQNAGSSFANVRVSNCELKFLQTGLQNSIYFANNSSSSFFIGDDSGTYANRISMQSNGYTNPTMEFVSERFNLKTNNGSAISTIMDYGVTNSNKFTFKSKVHFDDDVENSSGSVQFTSTRKVKENIEDIPKEEYSTIYKMKPKKYNLKKKRCRIDYGFLAEDLSDLKMEALIDYYYYEKNGTKVNVFYDEKGKNYEYKNGKKVIIKPGEVDTEEKNLTLDPNSAYYIEIVPLLVSCVKDQKTILTKHKDRIKKQKDKIKNHECIINEQKDKIKNHECRIRKLEDELNSKDKIITEIRTEYETLSTLVKTIMKENVVLKQRLTYLEEIKQKDNKVIGKIDKNYF